MNFFSRKAFILLGGVVLVLMQFILTPTASANSLSSNAKSTRSTTHSSCLQPSHKINIMTLSDAALMALGLPSQEVIHQNPAHWLSIFSHLGTHICKQGGHTLNLPKNIAEHQSVSPYQIGNGCNANSGSRCENDIWAGNLAIGKGRGAYRSGDLTVTVPTISNSPSTGEVAYWTGVGGDNWITGNPVLVQAGIFSDISSNGHQFNESIVQVAPNVYAGNLPLCRLAAGDKIEAYAESNVGNDGYDYFFMDNESDGYCYNDCYVQTSGPSLTNVQPACLFPNPNDPNGPEQPASGSSFNSDSTTGECIVERLGGALGNPLAEFNPSSKVVQLQNCIINSTGVGAQAHNYMVIENKNGQLLAGPGSIGSDKSSFPVIWHQSS